LEKNAADTAEFLLFMDALFDSLNGHTRVCPKSKPLKGAVRLYSGHQQYWLECINTLNTFKFFNSEKQTFCMIPSITNLIHTLKGMHYLMGILFKNNFEYVIPRNINQDALEIFFGCIRSHGVRNNSPDVSHFISSFKSLVINNYMSRHSVGRNCGRDYTEGALDNLHCLLTGEVVAGVVPLESEESNINLGDLEQFCKSKKSKVSQCTLYYVAGYVAKKTLAYVNNCHDCKRALLCSDGSDSQFADFIEARAYKNCRLIKPGSFLFFITKEAVSRLFYILPRVCQMRNLSKILLKTLLLKINPVPFNNCSQHKELHLYILKLIIRCITYFWVEQINLTIKGKNDKFVRLFKKLSAEERIKLDPVKVMAHNKFLKRNSRKRKQYNTI
jgi:hypothetical protein